MAEVTQQDLRDFMEKFAAAATAKNVVAAPGGWAQAQAPATALPPIMGVAVALKVQTPGGRARVYLSLPAEVASSHQSLMGALEALLNAGFPLDLWQDRNSWGQGGGYRGGYGHNGGGRSWGGGGRW